MYRIVGDRGIRSDEAVDLAETAGMLPGALEASGQVIWVFSTDGMIVDCQGAIGEVLGATRDEMVGRSLESIVIPVDRQRTLAALFEVVATGEPARNFDNTALKPRGGTVMLRSGGILAGSGDDGDGYVIAVSTDITARREAERELNIERRRFSEAFENAPVGILLVHLDTDRGVLVCKANREIGVITGYCPEEMEGTWLSFSGRRDHSGREEALVRKLIGGIERGETGTMTFDRATLTRGGEARTLRVHVAALDPHKWGNADDDYPVNATIHLEDVTEQVRARDRLEYLANHDSLTGLFNRQNFAEGLDRYLAGGRHRDGEGALLSIDLDGFKTVNDTWGHHAGDRMLVEVAGLLRAAVREGDHVARVGGDEFAILLAGVGADAAAAVADKLNRTLADENLPITGRPDAGFTPEASIGVLMLAPELAGADEALQLCDRLMYEAKGAGGGGHVLGQADQIAS